MTNVVLGFNGERHDCVCGVYHLGNGYRAFHSSLGRFTTPDSRSPFGVGGKNPYAYCDGDPVNRADPSGHMSVGQWVGMGLGIVAGIALSIVTDGAAIPAVASLMATVTGEAMIGAGAEIVAETVDGKRINWGQVGIAAGIGAAAVLGGYGLGRLARFKGVVKRPFRGLMMGEGGLGRRSSAASRGSWASGGSGEYVEWIDPTPVDPNRYYLFNSGEEADVFRKGDTLLKTYNRTHEVTPDELRNEVSMFNRVYGEGAAKVKLPQSIKMPLIAGRPLSGRQVASNMTMEHVRALKSTLDWLHSLDIVHGDIHAGNILFDNETSQFNFIDFRYAKFNVTPHDVLSDHQDIQDIYKNWPGYKTE